MGQSIEHGGGHFGVTEDLRPIGEGEVRRYDDRGVFVELADEMQQHLRAGLAERQIAEFVDDDEVMTQQGLDDAAAPSGALSLFELIDEIDEIEEAAARSGADDRGGGRDRQVGLSRTGPADQDEIALGIDEVAGGEFANLPFVDRRALEDESLEVLQHWESRAAEACLRPRESPSASRSRLPIYAEAEPPFCRRTRSRPSAGSCAPCRALSQAPAQSA